MGQSASTIGVIAAEVSKRKGGSNGLGRQWRSQALLLWDVIHSGVHIFTLYFITGEYSQPIAEVLFSPLFNALV